MSPECSFDTVYFENGDYYEGEVINRVPDGKGTMYYENGGLRQGFWKMGVPITSNYSDKSIPGIDKGYYHDTIVCGGIQFSVGYGYDNDTICDAFKITKFYRGIRIHSNHAILLSLHDSVYRDGFGWCKDEDGDDIFIYTGEGLEGDQSLTRGNMFIQHSSSKELFLFVKRKPNDYVFHGKVILKRTDNAIEPDINGINRKVFKFVLVRV